MRSMMPDDKAIVSYGKLQDMNLLEADVLLCVMQASLVVGLAGLYLAMPFKNGRR